MRRAIALIIVAVAVATATLPRPDAATAGRADLASARRAGGDHPAEVAGSTPLGRSRPDPGHVALDAQQAGPATVEASATLGHAGRWMTDAEGRVVILHGVNVPTKGAAPPAGSIPAYPAYLDFGDDDAARIASMGFNSVRLTVERYAVEPTKGVFDAAYIDQFRDTIRILNAHGILTLIDFHQDDYGTVFFDNGYPDWMTVTDDLPNLFFAPFPTQYLVNPALNRAFDHLWANDPGPSGTPLQDDDAAILAHVAAALRGEPGVLGYEIINEPWPGSAYPNCMIPDRGCRDFDEGPLSAYYARMVAAIRGADPARAIWYEPLSLFNHGIPTYVKPPADDNLGFAFHDYTLACGVEEGGRALPIGLPLGEFCKTDRDKIMTNALSHSADTGSALLQTEFGATMNPDTITDQVTLYDEHMIPWMFWAYTRYIGTLEPNGKLKPAGDDANINWTVADPLIRPYPRLVSGTPTSWSYDPAANILTAAYSTARADGSGSFPPGSVTEIAVPPRRYPSGYSVTVAGGTVLSAPGAPVLRVAPCVGSSTVTVTVSAAAVPNQVAC